jgi:hypothetical protein
MNPGEPLTEREINFILDRWFMDKLITIDVENIDILDLVRILARKERPYNEAPS